MSRFQLWTPDLFGPKGGIRGFSTSLLTAVQRLQPFAEYDVFTKHDGQAPRIHPFLRTTHFHFSGYWPRVLQTPSLASQIGLQGLLGSPDLIIAVHANFSPVAYWVNRLRNTPYWIVAHGIEVWSRKHGLILEALHRAHKILAVSQYTRMRLIRDNGIAPDKIVILPNTVDGRRFIIAPKPSHLLQRFGLRPDQPVLLTVSRLNAVDRYKGYLRVLQAIPRIREALPQFRYILVGDGDDRDHVQSLVQDLHLEEHVTLAGPVSDADLPSYYNLCDAFAMPSTKEGFGIVFLEAMASGKPVLAGNVDGSVDALLGGQLGALIHPDDAPALASTLTAMLQKQYDHPLMFEPERLRQKVLENFGYDQFCNILASHLESTFPTADSLSR